MNKLPEYFVANNEGFKGEMLDKLLSLGYYRMHHFVFTCNETQTHEEGNTIPVFWLRTIVKQTHPGKAAAAIRKKCAHFSVHLLPAVINEEIEELYALYKAHVPFGISPDCNSYFHQPEIPDPFDSMMLQVRDNGRLIATGFFDKGTQSIAGIMNIYHPHYHTYSLGKFLILQKIQYALSQHLLYYYTGYISTGSTRFDYKTFPDTSAVQVYLPLEQKWVPYNWMGKDLLEAYYINHLV